MELGRLSTGSPFLFIMNIPLDLLRQGPKREEFSRNGTICYYLLTLSLSFQPTTSAFQVHLSFSCLLRLEMMIVFNLRPSLLNDDVLIINWRRRADVRSNFCSAWNESVARQFFFCYFFPYRMEFFPLWVSTGMKTLKKQSV